VTPKRGIFWFLTAENVDCEVSRVDYPFFFRYISLTAFFVIATALGILKVMVVLVVDVTTMRVIYACTSNPYF
jgi:hypothetical protein